MFFRRSFAALGIAALSALIAGSVFAAPPTGSGTVRTASRGLNVTKWKAGRGGNTSHIYARTPDGRYRAHYITTAKPKPGQPQKVTAHIDSGGNKSKYVANYLPDRKTSTHTMYRQGPQRTWIPEADARTITKTKSGQTVRFKYKRYDGALVQGTMWDAKGTTFYAIKTTKGGKTTRDRYGVGHKLDPPANRAKGFEPADFLK